MKIVSCDLFLGVPFNVASYSLLTEMIAQVTSMVPGEFIWVGGDAHLYANHFDQVRELLQREPLPLPTLSLNPEVQDIDHFTKGDIDLKGYRHHPPIKAPVAV